ncbi:hypothetical protein B0O99DRAFT_640249 [Bisporella sp. PMI_857]|nr:hypothetical protein B0O99DRAFT_640249 [Bisporella sp. PMI_857]
MWSFCCSLLCALCFGRSSSNNQQNGSTNPSQAYNAATVERLNNDTKRNQAQQQAAVNLNAGYTNMIAGGPVYTAQQQQRFSTV